MKFRPCIDIHNGKVKQIVGGSLQDEGDRASENFVSERSAADFARLYQSMGLSGGHVIGLNAKGSEFFELTRQQALEALEAAPGLMQYGGSVTEENAEEYLAAGASHVIVTSRVFKNGRIDWEALKTICGMIGADRLVLDVSCRRKGGQYFVVTDRWQKFTDVPVCPETLDQLARWCSQFLIHAADVEGKVQGPEEELIALLGDWNKIPVTYAGGIASLDDLKRIRELSHGSMDVTIGSALDLFGGRLGIREVLSFLGGSE